jgi:hypothetical protein
MKNTKRHVNILGNVREVIVIHGKPNNNGDWLVKLGSRIEYVPEHLFYHETICGLELRDSLEFKRRYPNHPISIKSVKNV